jgi:Uncharacterized protein conserved in bacteria (DUF2242)
MHYRKSTGTERACVAAAAVALLAGCASHRPPPQQFTADAPFSRTFSGSGDTVCWSVKRALLSQGYMLDRPNDAGVLTGSRDEQPQPKLNVTIRLQTSCADNRNGTSIVFVTATREDSRLQKMKQSTSVGVGPATLTMPSGSAEVLGTVRRVTITDPNFYNQFFALVQGYVEQERLAQGSRPAADSAGTAPAGNSAAPVPSERNVQGAPAPDNQPVAAPPPPAAQPAGGRNQ